MAAEVTRSNPPSVRAPTGYTHAVQISGEHRRLIISGQVGMALDGSVPGTGEGQIGQALANLRAVLESGGATLEDVVKTSVFLSDMADFPRMNEVYARAFGASRPARSTVQAAGLPRGVLVEIDAIAAVR